MLNQVMAQFSYGSFFLSSSLAVKPHTWWSGPRKKTTNLRFCSLQLWPRCGERKRTSPQWTTRSWAVVSATTMARTSLRRSTESDMSTSSCVTSPRSLAMTQWWTNVKTLRKILSVENLWCLLKSKICFWPPLLRMERWLDLLTSACSSNSFPIVFVDNPNVYCFGDFPSSLYQAKKW